MATQGAVSLGRDALEVVWPRGASSVLPYLWLRDNCDCSDCRVEQTSEKKFLIKDVAADLRPASVDLTGDLLVVTWPDGHRSRYSSADVLDLSATRGPDWQPWDAQFAPPRADFQGFLDDDRQAAAAIGDFLRFGVQISFCERKTPPKIYSDAMAIVGIFVYI